MSGKALVGRVGRIRVRVAVGRTFVFAASASSRALIGHAVCHRKALPRVRGATPPVGRPDTPRRRTDSGKVDETPRSRPMRAQVHWPAIGQRRRVWEGVSRVSRGKTEAALAWWPRRQSRNCEYSARIAAQRAGPVRGEGDASAGLRARTHWLRSARSDCRALAPPSGDGLRARFVACEVRADHDVRRQVCDAHLVRGGHRGVKSQIAWVD